MSDFPAGITPSGFIKRTLTDILNTINQECLSAFGSDFNISPTSTFGNLNKNYAKGGADLWDAVEALYNGYNPDTASGSVLDNLLRLAYLEPKAGSFSTVELTLTAADQTKISKGTTFSTSDGLTVVALDEDVTVSGTTALAKATCTTLGRVVIPAASIVKSVNPVSGLTGVTNLLEGVTGQDPETDLQKRLRRNNSLAINANGTADAIRSKINQIEGVTYCKVFNNTTDSEDGDTHTPTRSYQVIVYGGDDLDIAKVIVNDNPSYPWGTTTITNVPDAQGFLHAVKFTRAVGVPIYISVNIHFLTATYPADFATTITNYILSYCNGTLVTGRGFSIGNSIIQTELYTPVNMLAGHEINYIHIGTAPSPTLSADIPMLYNQFGEFTAANIIVTNS